MLVTTDPRRESPTAWPWREIEARIGAGACEELHRAYLARCSAYSKARREPHARPGRTTTKASRR